MKKITKKIKKIKESRKKCFKRKLIRVVIINKLLTIKHNFKQNEKNNKKN
jgi:hypothetical protein